MGPFYLSSSTYVASLVEMIEALTIVLAIGVSREWRSTLFAACSAIASLAVITAIFGSAVAKIPITDIWIVMGGLLLVFGLQWLRNAILRFCGLKPLHDEAATYKKVRSEAKRAKHRERFGMDWYAYTLVFKGVFLEGLEVVFIVLSFGSSQGKLSVGVHAAVAAFITVLVLGLLLHRPLAHIPENTMKYIVGLVLTTFGTYFVGRGLGIYWPGGQMAFSDILVFYLVISGIMIWHVKKSVGSTGYNL